MSDGAHAREFIDIRELSARSGRSVSALRRDVEQGRIEAFQPGGPGGKLLFRPDALAKCRVVPGRPPHRTGTALGEQSGRLSGRRPAWMAAPTPAKPTTSEGE